MISFQYFVKRFLQPRAHSVRYLQRNMIQIPPIHIQQMQFASVSKKQKVQSEEGEDEGDVLNFHMQKENMEDIQKEILIKDYETIMQKESEMIYQQSDKFSQNNLDFIERKQGENDENVVVLNKDSRQIFLFFQDAQNLIKQNKYKDSLQLLFNCVINDHNQFCAENNVYKLIGEVYSHLQEPDKAIRYYSKQIEQEKSRRIGYEQESKLNIHQCLKLLAQEYESIQKYSQACSLYELCLRIKFDPHISLHLAQLLFYKKSNYNQAIRYYEKILQTHPDILYQSTQSYDYFSCLLFQRKYLKIEKFLEGKVEMQNYIIKQTHDKVKQNLKQHKSQNLSKRDEQNKQKDIQEKQNNLIETQDQIQPKIQNLSKEIIIKDWRIALIYRLGFMHTNRSFNIYASFVIQALYEVLLTDLIIKKIQNIDQFEYLNFLKDKQSQYCYDYDIDHICLTQTLSDCVSLIKNKGVQEELNEFESKFDIEELKLRISKMNNNDIDNYLNNNVVFTRNIDLQNKEITQIQRKYLFEALFPYLKYMLRFLYSHFHKIGNFNVAEYFILQENKISKNDISALNICKKLYEKDNLQLYTSLQIDFYEANKDELQSESNELPIQIFNNCKKLGLYESAAKYLDICLKKRQSSINLELKRQLIVQAAFLFYYLDQRDLFLQYYNQIKNQHRFPQLKIFFNIETEDFKSVKTIIEQNFINKKNSSSNQQTTPNNTLSMSNQQNQISINQLFYEYYIISLIKTRIFQNLDIVIKNIILESRYFQNSNMNFILYGQYLFTSNEYKYTISFMNLAMECFVTLNDQSSDVLCEINFYLALSHFFLKQYDQTIRHSENFITIYNTKYPNIPKILQKMEIYIIIAQIISYAKKSQIQLSQNILETHKESLQQFIGKSIFIEIIKYDEILNLYFIQNLQIYNKKSGATLSNIAELEYAIIKKNIHDFQELDEKLKLYLKQLKKQIDLSFLDKISLNIQ